MINHDEISREDMMFLVELYVQNERMVKKLLEFLRLPPAIGSLTIRVRDGKIHNIERIEQTY